MVEKKNEKKYWDAIFEVSEGVGGGVTRGVGSIWKTRAKLALIFLIQHLERFLQPMENQPIAIRFIRAVRKCRPCLSRDITGAHVQSMQTTANNSHSEYPPPPSPPQAED